MDQPSVNFIELVALTRITAESTVERFGSSINSSFFDASNILAGMKQKGLVDFMPSFPSASALKITDAGSQLLGVANGKAAEPLDALDLAILGQLSNGRRGLIDLNGAVNVAQTDLAFHLFKLSAQQYMSYEIANGSMSMHLTEKGFLSVKSVQQQVKQADTTAQHDIQALDTKQLEQKIASDKSSRKMLSLVAVVIVVVAAVVVLALLFVGHVI